MLLERDHTKIMTNEQIEKAAEIVFTMCKSHPEFCPHQFQEKTIKTDNIKKTEEILRVCNICGKRIKETRRI
jgi:hypothetical protein